MRVSPQPIPLQAPRHLHHSNLSQALQPKCTCMRPPSPIEQYKPYLSLPLHAPGRITPHTQRAVPTTFTTSSAPPPAAQHSQCSLEVPMTEKELPAAHSAPAAASQHVYPGLGMRGSGLGAATTRRAARRAAAWA